MPAISVIMPVYNSEKYLRSAVDSVLKQTFQDFELILIDDGSKDGSSAICDEYGGKDSRVVVIHQKNGGICAARNKGLDEAKGEYLAFIDNDDVYDPALLADNYALSQQYQADIVKFGAIKTTLWENGRKEIVEKSVPELMVLDSNQLARKYVYLRNRRMFDNLWNGLYRTDFIRTNGIRFDESFLCGGDDQIFTMSLHLCNPVSVFNPRCYYNWLQREGHSTSLHYRESMPRENYLIFEKECQVFQKLQVPDISVLTIDAYGYLIGGYFNYILYKGCPLSKKEILKKMEEDIWYPLYQKYFYDVKDYRKEASSWQTRLGMWLIQNRWFSLWITLQKMKRKL